MRVFVLRLCTKLIRRTQDFLFGRYDALPVSALVGLVTLTFDLGYIIARGMDNLPTNFGLPKTFRSRLIGQHLSDASRDLATLTFDLEDHGACR